MPFRSVSWTAAGQQPYTVPEPGGSPQVPDSTAEKHDSFISPTDNGMAYSLGLEVLVEVHDREELESVAFLQPQILGVNNRNLKTFEVNLDTVAKLRPYAPENAVFVSESGIRNHADMQMVRQLGADAVLIGETLMRSGNVTETLHQLREGI